MYEGTVATKAAASSPAPSDLTSFTKPYVVNAQKAENSGAVNTQTCSTHPGVIGLPVSAGSRATHLLHVYRDVQCVQYLVNGPGGVDQPLRQAARR
jgi:hypothetical protein